MPLSEVQSWPSSLIVEWQAHFVLQHEDRHSPPVDEAEVEEKLKRVLKPRPHD